MRLAPFILFLTCVLFTCGSKQAFNDYSFMLGVSKGTIDNSEIDEASGLAASVKDLSALWTHNDSGDKGRIFRIDTTGHFLNEVTLEGIGNRDWEDIAVGTGPNDLTYIYVADIGDNSGKNIIKTIYRFEEPRITASGESIRITKIDSIKFSYPDGPRDAESLFVDPLSKSLFILSKREEKEAHVYELPFPQSTTETAEATLVMKIPFTGFVAADMSGDGRELLAKTYTNVFYWTRLADESIPDMLSREPSRLPYATEPQGESIAFDRSGKGYFTLSEASKKKVPHLMFYRRLTDRSK